MIENNNDMLDFSTQDNPAAHIIKVMGVGGGGTNAVNHMFRQGITDVDFIVCNTDAKSLNTSPVSTKIQLGTGLGAGNNPEVAKRYAEESEEEIIGLLSRDTKMLFITAGMGGGTGTGASPVIAEFAKKIDVDDEIKKILVIGIVTLPFSFEGNARRMQAEQGVRELRKHLDSILIINNDKLFSFGKMKMSKMFAEADNVLLGAAKSIADMITRGSYVNIDFRDVNTVMANSGTALMGSGEASGEKRAIEAIQHAVESPLLNDNNIKGAKNILLHFSSSKESEIDGEEIYEITEYIKTVAGDSPQVIWGAGFDESLGETLKVIFVATGFEQGVTDKPQVVGIDVNVLSQSTEDSKKHNEESLSVAPQSVVSEQKAPMNVIKMDENGHPFEDKSEAEEAIVDTSDAGISLRPVEPLKQAEVASQPQTRSFVAEIPTVVIPVAESEPVVESKPVVEAKPVVEVIPVAEARPVEEPVVPQVQQEVVAREVVAPQKVAPAVSADTEREWTLKTMTQDRVKKVQAFKKLMATPGGIDEIESVPAYKANNVILENIPHSSQSEVQYTLMGPDGTPRPNDFINKVVD